MRGEPHGKILRTEVLEDLIADPVLGVNARNSDARLRQHGAGGEPPPQRALLFRRIEDAEDGGFARDREPEVAPPSDVSGEDLDRARLVSRTPRELPQAAELRRNQRGEFSRARRGRLPPLRG